MKTHFDHSDGLATSRSSPLPLDELAPYSSNTEQPDTLATQSANLLLSSFEVAVVQVEVGLRKRRLVGKDEVGDERGRLAGVASLGQGERRRESLRERKKGLAVSSF